MTKRHERTWPTASPLSDTEDQDRDDISVFSDAIGSAPKRGVSLLRVIGNIPAFESQRSHLDVLQLMRQFKSGTHRQTDARWDLRVIEQPNWQVDHFAEWCNEMLAGCQPNMRFYACDDLSSLDLTFESEPDLTQSSSQPSLASATTATTTVEKAHESCDLYAKRTHEPEQDDDAVPLFLSHFASPPRPTDPAAAAADIGVLSPIAIPSAPHNSASTTPNSSPQRERKRRKLAATDARAGEGTLCSLGAVH